MGLKLVFLHDLPGLTGPIGNVAKVLPDLVFASFDNTGIRTTVQEMNVAFPRNSDMLQVLAFQGMHIEGRASDWKLPNLTAALIINYVTGLTGALREITKELFVVRFICASGTSLVRGRLSDQGLVNRPDLLELFTCDGCDLSGPIPDAWCALHPVLTQLSLRSNLITAGPQCARGQLPSLTELALDENPITGTLDSWAWLNRSGVDLIRLGLSGTLMTGSLAPLRLATGPDTKALRLGRTPWTGNGDADEADRPMELPQWPFALAGLDQLDLSNGGWSGRLDSATATMPPALRVLDISHNALTGDLPAPPSSVVMYSAAYNGFAGACNSDGGGVDPASTWFPGGSTGLVVLDLSHNSLCGPYPAAAVAAARDSLQVLNMHSAAAPAVPGPDGTSLIDASDLNGARCLESLDLGGMPHVQGSLPDLGTLLRLEALRADGSRLAGGIGVSSGQAARLPPSLRIVDTSDAPELIVNVSAALAAGVRELKASAPPQQGEGTESEWMASLLLGGSLETMALEGTTMVMDEAFVIVVDGLCWEAAAFPVTNHVPACALPGVGNSSARAALDRVTEISLDGTVIRMAGRTAGATVQPPSSSGDRQAGISEEASVLLRAVCLMPRLRKLTLRDMGLRAAVLPPCLGALQRLEVLDLSGNGIGRLPGHWAAPASAAEAVSGTIRRTTRSLAKSEALPMLRLLDLSRNDMSGQSIESLIATVSTLASLSELRLESTSLHGRLDDVALQVEVASRVVLADGVTPAGSVLKAGELASVGNGMIQDTCAAIWSAPTSSVPLSPIGTSAVFRIVYPILTLYSDLLSSNAILTSQAKAVPSLARLLLAGNPDISGGLWPKPPSALRLLDVSGSGLRGAIPDSFSRLDSLDVRSTSMRGVTSTSADEDGADQVVVPPAADASAASACCTLPFFAQAGAVFTPAGPGSAYECLGVRPAAGYSTSLLVDLGYDAHARCRCAAGYYGPRTQCLRCPTGSTSPAGATHLSHCGCRAGSQLVNSRSGVALSEAVAGAAAACALDASAAGCRDPASDPAEWVCQACSAGSTGAPSAGRDLVVQKAVAESSALVASWISTDTGTEEPAAALDRRSLMAALVAEPQCVACATGSEAAAGSATPSGCMCLPGRERNLTSPEAGCGECPANTAKVSAGEDRCKPCPSGTYSPRGSTVCSPCVSEGVRCADGRVWLEPGYYSPGNATLDLPLDAVQAMWGMEVHPAAELLGCFLPGACQAPEGAALRCAEGYEGKGCLECSAGYVASGPTGLCSECPTGEQLVLGSLGLVAVVSAIAVGVTVLSESAPAGRRGRTADAVTSLLRVSFDHAMLTSALLATIVAASRDKSLKGMLAVIDMAGSLGRVMEPLRCVSGGIAPTMQPLLRIALAASVLAACMGAVYGISRCRRAKAPCFKAAAAGLAVVMASYPGTLRWAAGLVQCVGDSDGAWVVAGLHEISCHDPEGMPNGLVWWVGMITLAVMGVALPASVGIVLLQSWKRLTSDSIVRALGFVYRGLRLPGADDSDVAEAQARGGRFSRFVPQTMRCQRDLRLVYTVAVVLPRLASVTALMTSDDVEGEMAGALGVLVGWLVLLLVVVPYQAREIVAWEAASLLIGIAHCLAGVRGGRAIGFTLGMSLAFIAAATVRAAWDVASLSGCWGRPAGGAGPCSAASKGRLGSCSAGKRTISPSVFKSNMTSRARLASFKPESSVSRPASMQGCSPMDGLPCSDAQLMLETSRAHRASVLGQSPRVSV